jgi:phage terminase large subunit
MWWSMREWLQSGGAIPNDTTLKAELATPTYEFDMVGRRVLESKDEIKKRLQGGASPDIADALALTFAYPVAKQLPREIRERIDPRAQTDYDPYEAMQ